MPRTSTWVVLLAVVAVVSGGWLVAAGAASGDYACASLADSISPAVPYLVGRGQVAGALLAVAGALCVVAVGAYRAGRRGARS
ncbi:hypothetical protein [Solicola sp. PLA-1-18]|uniref:hypothetical protein n=1 Tax=Solicola sp. PLA-1-18 TaxID=3380532 RepID=UPI003B7CBD1A